MNLKVHLFQSYINKIHHTIVYTGSIAEYHDGWLRILLSQYVSCIDGNTKYDRDLGLSHNAHFQSVVQNYKHVVTRRLGTSIDLENKGKYWGILQFETVRKLRSTYCIIWNSLRQTLTTSVIARDLKKTYVTFYSTYGLWFEKFIIGMHKRMVVEVHQDEVVTLAIVHKLVNGLEIDFLVCIIDEEREGFVDQAIFILAAFLVAFRGGGLSWCWERKELILWKLGGIRSYLM